MMADLKKSPENKIAKNDYVIDEEGRLALLNALSHLPYREAYRLMNYLSNLEPMEDSKPKIIME